MGSKLAGALVTALLARRYGCIRKAPMARRLGSQPNEKTLQFRHHSPADGGLRRSNDPAATAHSPCRQGARHNMFDGSQVAISGNTQIIAITSSIRIQ